MKNINRLLAAAAILLSAAACHTSEIDNPGHTDPVNPDPGTPDESGLTITANIVKTRVTYNDRDEGYLDQQWEEGDILFGYYYEEVANKVILQVDSFDSNDNAILIPLECNSVATLKDLADLNEGVNVDLVYTGKNIEDFGDNLEGIVVALFGSNPDGPLTVDLSSQDGIRIPACMHARASIVVDKNDPNKKSLFFKFVNDCAIIEIYSLTGIKGKVSDNTYLKSISVSNLLLQGTYSWSDTGGFTFAQTAGTKVGNFSANLSGTDWYVNSDGSIHKGDSERYLIAVVPNEYLQEIEVSATIDSEPYRFGYGKHSFEAGMCYVICEEAVVAKTVDGRYFTTVAAAFDHAAEIAEELEGDPTKYGGKNIVTLVKENITGLGDHPEPSYVQDDDFSDGTDDSYYDASLMIEIDYDVTLDLNGCTLSLIDADVDGDDTSECFYVDAYVEDETGEGHLTIKDSRSGGTIESGADSHIIINEGKVTIMGGRIKQTMETNGWCAVRNYGELNVSDGAVLYSYSFYAISNDSSVTIDDGSISAYSSSAIRNGEDGELTINDGKVYSSSSFGYAVENKGDLYVYGGEVYTDGAGSAIFSDNSLAPGAIVTIGGTENNASGPCIHNDSYEFPSIYIIGPSSGNEKVTFTMNQGLVYGSSGAFIFQGRVESSIKGGEIATGYINWSDRGKNKAFSAISLYDNVLSCEISGGKIITGKYGQSCIYSRASDVTLTLKWDGQNRSEPFLYSKCNTAGNCPPLQVVTGARCNINILGGLIYEGGSFVDPPSDVFLYNDTKVKNLSLSNFYSNKLFYTAYIDKKDTYTFTNYSEGYTVNARDINIDGVITIDETELNFYHIEPPAESPSAPAGTSKYYFDSFDW